MKNKSKVVTFAMSLIMALSILVGAGHKKNVYAAVGQQLNTAETGWKRYEENYSKILYPNGSWIPQTNVVYSGGKNVYTNVANKTIKFKFSGTKIRIISDTAGGRSSNVTIKIDDESFVFSCIAEGAQVVNALVYEKTGLTLGIHTIEIVTNEDFPVVFEAIDIDDTGYLVDVSYKFITGISINKTTLNLNIGQEETLIPKIIPEDATNKNVKWISNHPEIATVNQTTGLVTAIAAGSSIITATAQDGSNLSASCTVTVKQAVSGITLNKIAESLNVGQTDILIATLLPADATNKDVTWTSSDNNIVTVDNTGKITAIKAGTAVITVTTVDGSKTATCSVTVTDNSRAILAITMSNGERKEFDLSSDEVTKFVTWYNGNTSTSYAITKNYNVKPFNSRTEYIAHDKVSSFEVNEYTDVQK
jgi:uncharacterized protein YjdB